MRFRYIQLSDFHLCLEPKRNNALSLLRRRPRQMLDTAINIVRGRNFASLAKPASYNPDIISGVAQFCFERANAIDGIIITGDLATTGMMNDIGVAYSFVADPAIDGYVSHSVLPTLCVPRAQVYVVPGNHDKYRNNMATPNCRNFELRFDNYMPNFNAGVGHSIHRKGDFYVGFVFADFSLQEPIDALDRAVGLYGQGRVYQEIMSELRDRTLSLRNRFKGIKLLWIIHFAPFDCGYNLALIGWEEVIQVAPTLGVIATLCGHTHKASKYVKEKHTVYCAGSAGCVDSESDSRVQVINLDVGDHCRITRENYRWSMRHHEFRLHDID